MKKGLAMGTKEYNQKSNGDIRAENPEQINPKDALLQRREALRAEVGQIDQAIANAVAKRHQMIGALSEIDRLLQ